MHKHRVISAAVGLLFLVFQSAVGVTFGLQVTSYDIHASIHPHADTIHITARITAASDVQPSPARILLSSSARIERIDVRSTTLQASVSFRFLGNDTLELAIPKTFPAGSEFELLFTYQFPIHTLSDTLLLLDRGHRWYPLIPDQLALLALRCDVPQGYTVLSSGDLIKRENMQGTESFFWKSAQPVFKIPMVVFPSLVYRERSLDKNPHAVALYSTIDDSLASPLLAEASRAMDYFSGFIGSYAHRRLTLVEVPDFEGMNIASGLVMIGSSFLSAMVHGEYDGLHLAVAEQWIGAGVFGRYGAPGFWFTSISMPHYLRLMYVRKSRGEEAYMTALNSPLKKYEAFAGKENDVPLMKIDAPNTKEKGLILYGNGPFVLSRLHASMGDKVWQALWMDIYKTFRGRILTVDEFRARVVGREANAGAGKMFDRMLNEKGIPEEAL